MVNWLKQNWFKIIILILISLYVFISRIYFINSDGEIYKCSKFTGNCERIFGGFGF